MTEMLRILPYNSVTFDKGIVIGDAYDVRVTYEINGERRLDFSHPINEKSEIISENKIVVCEGQAYRIIKVSTDGDVKTQIGNVNGQFVFNITDNNGNSAVNITDKGNMNFKGDFETEKLSVGDNVITQDSNGVLCINGKRILVEGE